MTQQQQWIIVGKPKRKQIKKQEKLEDKRKKLKIVYEPGKPLYLADNQQSDIQQFMNSPCFKTNGEMLRNKITERYRDADKLGIHIECLGLGDFIKYAKPRYQFYFLMHLLIPLCRDFTQDKITINCYDPIFSKQCIGCLEQIGTVKPDHIPHLQQNHLIILYMPHCQRFLYERYCCQYSGSRVLVIGNSLKDYQNRCQLISEPTPKCFLNRDTKQVKVKDFRQSLNDTFCYYI